MKTPQTSMFAAFIHALSYVGRFDALLRRSHPELSWQHFEQDAELVRDHSPDLHLGAIESDAVQSADGGG
jgi:hypothetical protein